MRPKLTYSNVVATLALVIAVGGASAFAATQLAKNSVGSKQLKKNAVTTAKIKNRAVTAAKLSGAVPSAVNAQTLGGLSVDQVTQGSKLRCPAGTELVAGVCFDNAPRSPDTFYAAVETCAGVGRSLASVGEMTGYLDVKGGPKSVNFWFDTYFTDEGEFKAGFIQDGKTKVALGVASVLVSLKYWCVTSPTN